MKGEYQFSLDHIHDAAHWFWDQMADHKVVALHGHMGAGKTSFVHALCDVINIKDPVSSPTFSLINEYLVPGGEKIFHIDLYRIKDEEEAIQAGIEDVLYSGSVCFVEWPEKAPAIFPTGTLEIRLFVNPDQSRTIKLL
ncbi:MAG TPA: tRNA (adenosine(37)-N6)-threonylcarbamoyltransferase complex ATPase subunit type 1 TsaE [Chitinophagaceae bacterium]|nr:tRNA (adenosine(37)-N6)-threonylcarbamoyltransferase complex ATPase subunit type 1 TsaE [Chitinophagaceae bacterium]